jgi:ATP-dependent Lon protease
MGKKWWLLPKSRNALATSIHLGDHLMPGKQPNQWLLSRKKVPTAIPARRHYRPTNNDSTVVAEPLRSQEKHFTIFYGDTGYGYETIIGPYLHGAKAIGRRPYIRMPHQIQNFVRCAKQLLNSSIKRIDLVTGYDDETQRGDIEQKLGDLKQSLLETDVVFDFDFNSNLHDREIRIDNGWVIKIGRGLDFYQKPVSWYELGTNDLTLRKCLETKVDIFRINQSNEPT